ncbi:unnamed protein product [Meloidogyne enterolobii]|uniref:Uncharacterized protein n=1 Tax=Meloidogyne enterolobii TaxID=390850 RepID=A0ACB0ZP81_MELEN
MKNNSKMVNNISVENKESLTNNLYIPNIRENNNKNGTLQRQKMWKAQPIQIKTTLSPELQQIVQNVSLIFLTFSQTVNPLIARIAHKHAKETSEPFIGSTIVLIIEICVPAIIYVVQNNLYFFVLKRVDATLYTMTFQLKILATALLSMLLLSRIFSRIQWGALCISVLGVCLVQISKDSGNESPEHKNEELIGLLTIFVMCWTSAFAGVYLEAVLKQSSCDIWMQNIRISLITLPFALLTIVNDADKIQKRGSFFAGWTWRLWLIVLSSSANGLIVAFVYADNIKKSYCQTVALGGTALLSILLGDSQFSFSLIGGVSLVICSVFLYTLNPPKLPTLEVANDEKLLMDEDNESSEDDDEERLETFLDYKKKSQDVTPIDPTLKQQSNEALISFESPTFRTAASKLQIVIGNIKERLSLSVSNFEEKKNGVNFFKLKFK